MSEEAGFPDLSGILARVTENPQAMAMLSSLLGGASSASKESESATPPPAKDQEIAAPVLARAQHTHKDGKAEQRRRLLLALKPFLSRERGQALETLLLVLDAISLLPRGKEPPCT